MTDISLIDDLIERQTDKFLKQLIHLSFQLPADLWIYLLLVSSNLTESDEVNYVKTQTILRQIIRVSTCLYTF